MSKGIFIGYMITGIAILSLIFFFAGIFGSIQKPIIQIGSAILFIQFAFPKHGGLMKIKKLDEREQLLIYKIMSVTAYTFLIILILISTVGEFKIFEYRINEIWGHLILPVFFILMGIVGLIILKAE